MTLEALCHPERGTAESLQTPCHPEAPRRRRGAEGSHGAWSAGTQAVLETPIRREILPLRISSLDESDLSLADPPLDLLFARDSSGDVGCCLDVNQFVEVVSGCEGGSVLPQLVLEDPRPEVAGDARVEDGVVAVRHDVDGDEGSLHRRIPAGHSSFGGGSQGADDPRQYAMGFFGGFAPSERQFFWRGGIFLCSFRP